MQNNAFKPLIQIMLAKLFEINCKKIYIKYPLIFTFNEVIPSSPVEVWFTSQNSI